MLSSSSAVSPSPAMSAAIAARRRPSRMASRTGLVLNKQHTHALDATGGGHIVGISKIAYGLVTPRCLDWGVHGEPARTTGSRTRSTSPPLSSSVRLLSAFSATRRWRPRLCRQRHQSRQHSARTTVRVAIIKVHLTRLTLSSLRARRSSMTTFRPPTLTRNLPRPPRAALGRCWRRGRVLRQQWLAFPEAPGTTVP